MIRGAYQAVVQRNASVMTRIHQIKADHPFWGYRRIWAYLNHYDKLNIGINRVYRLMKAAELLVTPAVRRQIWRPIRTKKPRATRPNQWWGIDMTNVMIETFGRVYVVIVLDWYTKKVVGHYAGAQCKAAHWELALDRAVNRQFPDGARDHGLKMMSDNGSQPTSRSFTKTCRTLGIIQAFTSYNNPKGNADTERFMRTMKEELVWCNEWTQPTTFFKALDEWMHTYNTAYLHSTLGYCPPEQFEINYLNHLPLQDAC